MCRCDVHNVSQQCNLYIIVDLHTILMYIQLKRVSVIPHCRMQRETSCRVEGQPVCVCFFFPHCENAASQFFYVYSHAALSDGLQSLPGCCFSVQSCIHNLWRLNLGSGWMPIALNSL